jgi:hypothetical protein
MTQSRHIVPGYSDLRRPCREAVLHIGVEQLLVSFVDLLDGDDFDIGGDVVRTAEVQHLLCFRDAANG